MMPFILTPVPAADTLFLLPSLRSHKMSDSPPPIPAHLLAGFDAAVLRILETVGDGSLRCVQRPFRYRIILNRNLCNGDSSDNVLEQLLTGKITELIRCRDEHRNSRQPILRLSFGLLVRSMSFLSVQDILSVIKACRHLRASVCEASSLWTQVDEIDKPSTLRFVLERARSLPISITGLYIGQNGDDLLQIVASHMWHVRALGLYLTAGSNSISDGTHAHTLFTTPAPFLQRLMFSKAPCPTNDTTLPPNSVFTPNMSVALPLFGRVTPHWDVLYLRDVLISSAFIDLLPKPESLQTVAVYRSAEGKGFAESSIWNLAHRMRLATFNIELTTWRPSSSTRESAPSLRRINIHWKGAGPLVPNEVVPNHEHWKLVHVVHVSHVGDNSCSSSNSNGTAPVSIPATNALYSAVNIRSSITSDPRVNVRAVDMEGRERIFCGLQPDKVTSLLSRIPADRLSTVTITTAAVALNVLSNAQLPTLQCIRIISNTSDMGWISTFARGILNVVTLEHIELSVEGNPKTVGWPTSAVRRVLASCLAAGCVLEKVSFLGFEPGVQCASIAASFAEQVIVDRNWREPLEERIWFTQPSFEGM